MRADSISPQASGPSTTMMPTPAVAPMARSESEAYGVVKWPGPTQAPPYPPTRSAWGGAVGAARLATSISGVPRSISTTPGCSTAPEIVTSDVPGSSTRPCARNASGPVRAIIATCASVSALCTSAPRRPMRRVVPLSGRKDGRDCARLDPARQRRLLAGDEAVGWPDHDFGDRRAAGGDTLGQRPRHGCRDLVATLGHAHRHLARPAGGGEQLGAVEHQMG